MHGPAGEVHGADSPGGCFLVVEAPHRLVWTSALTAGFRPVHDPVLMFTAELTFETVEGGTRYHVRAIHTNEADAKKHAEMGFEAGWGKALEQLVELADTMMD